MANRSYLYASDAIPDGKTKIAPRGLCEYNWDIPLVHKLVMGGAPRRVHSAIWPQHEIGIIANRQGAIERVEAFAAKLLEGDLDAEKRTQLESELADMRAVSEKTPATPYLLLEVGEIVDMMGGELVDQADKIVKEIPAVVARAERAVAGKEDAWLAELRGKPLDEFNFGFWSDVLYFSFGEDEGDDGGEDVEDAEIIAETPAKAKAKEKAAAKQVVKKPAAKAAKKPAAKKPAAAKAAKKPAAAKAAKKPKSKATKSKPAAKSKATKSKPAAKAAKPAAKAAKKPAAKKKR